MRVPLVAAVSIAAVLLVIPCAATAASMHPDRVANHCLGLACADPGSENDVLEARAWVTVPDLPREVERVRDAGFFEFGHGYALGQLEPAIAYVVPFGQEDRMPASVRALQIAQDLESGGHFERGTVVIFGQYVSLTVGQSRVARRGVHATSAVDWVTCNDNYMCLYGSRNYGCCQFFQASGPTHGRDFWMSLGVYHFNDTAASMKNRRDRDSHLAEHTGGGGRRYCADSHSSDGDFDNNAIGRHRASSLYLSSYDSGC